MPTAAAEAASASASASASAAAEKDARKKSLSILQAVSVSLKSAQDDMRAGSPHNDAFVTTLSLRSWIIRAMKVARAVPHQDPADARHPPAPDDASQRGFWEVR